MRRKGNLPVDWIEKGHGRMVFERKRIFEKRNKLKASRVCTLPFDNLIVLDGRHRTMQYCVAKAHIVNYGVQVPEIIG